MAFGFPAYHEETSCPIPPGYDMGLTMMNTLRALGWGPSFDSNGITASTGASLKSFGEKITVTLSEGTVTKIRSECSLPTQCFDSGKNRENVKLILAELPKHYVPL